LGTKGTAATGPLDPKENNAMTATPNPWDEYAEEYVAFNRQRYPEGAGVGGMLTQLLDLLGDMEGKAALDAGCGEGPLARALAERGARVTGIDLSPRLIAMAREQDPAGNIDYRVGDLSEPQPDLEGAFDLIGSYLALNDVARYREFATTLAALLKPGGRLALAFNNPYSSVVREHIGDYFDEETMGTYLGMWEQGIRTRYHHRTLGHYLDAFLDAGLRLAKLVDVPDVARHDWGTLKPGSRFPRFMMLAFHKQVIGAG